MKCFIKGLIQQHWLSLRKEVVAEAWTLQFRPKMQPFVTLPLGIPNALGPCYEMYNQFCSQGTHGL